jgi:membrane complex biogenesis BtpA family protein
VNHLSKLPRIVGVVHLDPLPGTPRGGDASSIRTILDHARRDAGALATGGVNAIIVENFGDNPFARDHVDPEVISAMTRAVEAVIDETGLPVGVNVLRNDGVAAVSIAAMAGAQFIRSNVYVGAAVTDQGLIQGNAREIQEAIKRLGCKVDVWADVDVKHAAQLTSRPIEELAEDAIKRGLARAVIITGSGTGKSADLEQVRSLEKVNLANRLVVGSGVTDLTVTSILGHASAVIVGTFFKRGGVVTNPVDVERVRKVVKAASS